MNNLEIRLITDNILRFGGFREKEVLKDLIKIELIMNTKEHKVYKFESKDGSYFEYDFISHLVVG